MHYNTYCQKLSSFNFKTNNTTKSLNKNTTVSTRLLLVLTVVFFVKGFGCVVWTTIGPKHVLSLVVLVRCLNKKCVSCTFSS